MAHLIFDALVAHMSDTSWLWVNAGSARGDGWPSSSMMWSNMAAHSPKADKLFSAD
ncbi:hypothetical protein FQN57_003937 [Myotisia sp. PD_48]|nr:hypothetical protein FQN57_003937 [Myotisia sp. PD_48]